MRTLKERLRTYEKHHGPVRVGLVGAGQMGTGLISQMEKMVGLKVVAVADVVPNRAAEAYAESDVSAAEIAWFEEDTAAADGAIAAGRRVATHSSDFLCTLSNLDVIVESTGIPNVGAEVCYRAIMGGKHVVNMNVEADATIGFYLANLAKEQGVVYSLAAGDEPGTIKEIFDFADALGFEIVMVGKGKNNPLNRASNPDTTAAKAQHQEMSAKMLASFEDGTKTMVEMTSIGNALGFPPEVRGAHGPNTTVKELATTFSPREEGGILGETPVVDYAIGDVAPGVFVVITTDQPKIIKDLNYLRLNGNGKYWVLYRPYHLANLETPITIANVALDQRPTLLTEIPPVCETVATAKRDLKVGETIDALGGYTVYGMIDRAAAAHAGRMLPLGLAVGARVIRDVPLGQPLTYDDVELDDDQLIVQLRRQQDEMVFERA
ncbi:MAG: SAF domain-containing protein [Ardenticatenaceae bacterium]|nr:SAF domain-containing protein [Ardenticatenaceae bacterium]